MIRRRFPPVLALALIAAAMCIVIAAAASLPVTSGPLSTYSVSGSVPETTCSLAAPNADTYVDEPSTSNFGGAVDLLSSTRLFDNQHTYVMFDVASCSIPSDAEVRSATLSLYLWDAPATGYAAEVRRITSTWAELTAQWFAQPSVAGSATTTFNTGTTDNVTLSTTGTLSDVRKFVDGTYTNYGWRVKPSSDSQDLAQFNSKEHADSNKRPKLTITYYP